MDPIVKETFGSDRRQNKKGCDVMAATESVTIKVPVGMSKYLKAVDSKTELIRNALLLYPYSYLDMTMDGLDSELEAFRQLKKGRP